MGAEFNYFTEVEDHFQRVRGTALFLLSPLDWALLENWKKADIPLEAVLRGIEAAFAKRRPRFQNVNSLAYCAQAVYAEAKNAAAPRKPVEAPFPLDQLESYMKANADALRAKADFRDIVASLEDILANLEQHYASLEALEQRLTVLEEKMAALARSRMSEEELLRARQELDFTLRPYRSKMTADQLAMLERQYLERWLLEQSGLPRLSLFYLR